MTMLKKLSLIPAMAALLLLSASPAAAQCETALMANKAGNALIGTQTSYINLYVTQELNFLSTDFKETATDELMGRYDQFRDKILAALNGYSESLMPDMREMSKQLSTAEIDQTRQLGSMLDARLQAEELRSRAAIELKANRDLTPAESTCVMDTVGPAQTQGYHLARAVARGLAHDAQSELGGEVGTVGARGTGATIAALHDEFKDDFCDPSTGDQGCTEAGPLAGRNNDLGGLLWGAQQSIDMDTPENKQVLEAVARNVAGPLPPEPMSEQEVLSASGIEEMMRRRAKRARINTIYNVIGQMTGERVGGTGANVQEIRTASGTAPEDASTDGSYREIQEASAKDRFTDPEYLFRITNYPAVVVRETGAVNAVRLMQLSDLYKRMEEMVWLEAAVLGTMLDRRIPEPGQ